MLAQEYILDVLAKVTVLLAFVSVADLVLRRASAGVRHRVWAATFVALLLLPPLSATMPEWRLAVLPADWLTNAEEVSLNTSGVAARQDGSAVTNAATDPPVEFAGPEPTQWQTLEIPVEPYTGERPILQRTETLDVGEAAAPAIKKATGTPPVGWLVAAAWAAGLLVAIGPLCIGLRKNALLRRASRRITGTESLSLLADLCGKLGIRRRVDLFETRRAIVPMTWGVWRPTVVIPAAWSGWVAESRRLVLLHELAHVKRLDVVYQAIARIACSIYWFHPLAWYALRRLRVERELACDDCVLMAGEQPSEYAQQLLEVAREYQSAAFPPAVAMVHRSGLEQRVRALLDRARSHLPISVQTARALLVGSLLAALLLAIVRIDAVAKAQRELNDAAETAAETAAEEAGESPLLIKGTVTGPDGGPIAEARVIAVRTYLSSGPWQFDHEVLGETTSDDVGRYSLAVPPKSDRFSDGVHFEQQYTHVFAVKQGFGPDQVDAEMSKETDLQLAASTVEIDGRIVDLEGRPMVGVQVRLQRIESAKAPLDAWVDEARNNPALIDDGTMAASVAPKDRPKVVRFPAGRQILAVDQLTETETSTDADGRFRLAGIGDDRLATLRIDSPQISSVMLQVVTREMSAVNMPARDPRYRSGKAFGRRFVYSAEPSQLIRGTVRDKESAEPLEGIRVSLGQYADDLLSIDGFLSAVTDANGNYELPGVPKAPQGSRGIRLRIIPQKGQPYFRSEKVVPKREGLDPISVDVELTRGILVEGSVTDQTTGAPVPAMVAYYPYRDNPYAEGHEAWHKGRRTMGYGDMFPTDADGRFLAPGLRGHGLLRVVAFNDTEYELFPSADINHFMRGGAKQLYHISMPGNAMVDVDIKPDDPVEHVNAALTPMESWKIRVTDPAGQDLAGYRVGGRHPVGRPTASGRGFRYWGQKAVHSATTEIFLGTEKERQRPLLFYHSDRKLGAVVPINELERGGDGTCRVALQPCATIVGRLVDGEGQPVTDGYIQAGIGEIGKISGIVSNKPPMRIRSNRYIKFRLQHVKLLDEDGRFEYSVPPGKRYTMLLGNSIADLVFFKDRTIQPGETIDLGTVDVTAAGDAGDQTKAEVGRSAPVRLVAATQAPRGEGRKSGDAPGAYEGTVVDTDGKPVGGAELFLVYRQPSDDSWKGQTRPVAVTDSAGKFQFVRQPAGKKPPTVLHAPLIVRADGYGVVSVISQDYTSPMGKPSDLGERRKKKIVLRRDESLRGTVVDLEGQPVEGAAVRLSTLLATPDAAGTLDAWEEEAVQGNVGFFTLRNKHFLRSLGGVLLNHVVQAARTDADGQFEMSGIGPDRIAQLQVTGPRIEATEFYVRTRQGERIVTGGSQGAAIGVFANDFQVAVGPGARVEGTITDADTGQPLEGIQVAAGARSSRFGSGKPWVNTTTDAEGKYTLDGFSFKEGQLVAVTPGRSLGYLPAAAYLDIELGYPTVSRDFKLRKGQWIRGRALDAASAQPLLGMVHYYVARDNPELKRYPDSRSSAIDLEAPTNADGEFSIAVPAGLGIIGFSPFDRRKYRHGSGIGEITIPYTGQGASRIYQTSPMMLIPRNETVVKQIEVQAGGNNPDIVLAAEAGALVQCELVDSDGEPLTNCLVNGVFPESPIWVHQQKAVTTLQAVFPDSPRDVFAFHHQRNLAGHAVIDAAKQRPTIQLMPAGGVTGRLVDGKGEPVATEISGIGVPYEGVQMRTDGDGRFHVRGLIPGRKYTLTATRSRRKIFENLQVAAGETSELGKIVLSN